MKSSTRIMVVTAVHVALLLTGAGLAPAQVDQPTPTALRSLDQQAVSIFRAVEPVLRDASAGTVEVRVAGRRIGFGTVVQENKVLAKWSDVRGQLPRVRCRAHGGPLLPVTVAMVYRDADLVLLEVQDLKAQPVVFDLRGEPRLGQFLVLARADGEAAALGVVSVLPRSLREEDRAFLGVGMDPEFDGPGVRVSFVKPRSAAARAGIKSGDVITGVRGRAVSGSYELLSSLQRLTPGEEVRIKFRRGEEQKSATVVLSGRPDDPVSPSRRADAMNRLGGHDYSEVRDDFRHVIQSDMQIEPEDCGAPVVNLQGRVVGVAVARAGRIKSFIIPAREVRKLLESKTVEGAARAVPVPIDPVDEADPFEEMRQNMWDLRRRLRGLESEEGGE